MLTTIGSFVGVAVMVIGAIWGAVTWAASKFGVKQSQLETVIKGLLDQLAPKDLVVSKGTLETANSRIDALQCADTLMRYFESVKSDAGQTAMQAVVTAIFVQQK
jgi:hypothetical protein